MKNTSPNFSCIFSQLALRGPARWWADPANMLRLRKRRKGEREEGSEEGRAKKGEGREEKGEQGIGRKRQREKEEEGDYLKLEFLMAQAASQVLGGCNMSTLNEMLN